MVRQGTQKKRRANRKTKVKLPKRSELKILQAVPPIIKQLTTYDKTKTPIENIVALGLDPDANKAIKRRGGPLTPGTAKVIEHKGFEGFVLIPNAENADGKGESKGRDKNYLTPADMEYISKLIKKHGDKYKKMAMDIKLNNQQHTEEKLTKLCQKYLAYTKQQEE